MGAMCFNFRKRLDIVQGSGKKCALLDMRRNIFMFMGERAWWFTTHGLLQRKRPCAFRKSAKSLVGFFAGHIAGGEQAKQMLAHRRLSF